MCFSSPGQTRRRLTEKRTLQPAPHGKAHSAQASHQKVHSGLIDSRKAAFCDSQIAQTAPFRHIAARGARGATPPPACGALWRMPQLGKRARATPRQPAGGLRQGPQASAWGLAARKGAVWAEGLADGAPWARPGHHQAASCGLRRCRELRISPTSRETVLSVKRLPRRVVSG